jgi:hypothetical protein
LGRPITPEEDAALDELPSAIDMWLRKGPAHLEDWYELLEDEIALAAYRATDEVYLDQYTYQGEDVIGIEPDMGH